MSNSRFDSEFERRAHSLQPFAEAIMNCRKGVISAFAVLQGMDPKALLYLKQRLGVSDKEYKIWKIKYEIGRIEK